MRNYKFGIIYAKPGQNENEMFQNGMIGQEGILCSLPFLSEIMSYSEWK